MANWGLLTSWPHNCGPCRVRGLVPHRKYTSAKGTARITLNYKPSLLAAAHWVPGVWRPAGKKRSHPVTGLLTQVIQRKKDCCCTMCMGLYSYFGVSCDGKGIEAATRMKW